MTTKIAFVGFRHPHINDMFARCQQHSEIEVVACCEEDAATRSTLAEAGDVIITHENYAEMLASTPCDIVAIGDFYQKRGSLVLQALASGRHVLSDKPLCTSLEELDQIEALATDKNLKVGCMFDMRDSSIFLGLRDLIQSGEIGEIRAVTFGGQHALNYGVRPSWYFEPGQHGGTINDIAVHAIDGIPWITGKAWSRVEAARCWNASLPQYPHFEECAQALLTLEGGAGVCCDVSYLSPNSFGFTTPLYWRFTFWGADGVLEAAYPSKTITLYKNGQTEAQEIEPPPGKPGGYLEAFLQEIQGGKDLHLSSVESLTASRAALKIQQAADQQLCREDL